MQLKYTWLPADKPDSHHAIQIAKAANSKLITADNRAIFDAISSWWCKPLGHAHPLVAASIIEQLKHFEHHIPAQAWNETIEQLSAKLVNIFTTMDKVVYASDGSSAIEIAMKLSYECRVLNKQANRTKFIALTGAYHGETIFTLGVCGLKHYTTNFSELLSENYFIEAIPYVSGSDDPLWNDCRFDYDYWDNYFSAIAPHTTALIFEPIVQGAAGMKIISRDFFAKLTATARRFDLHIIADEIMVGLGRLGVLSVSKDIIGIEPDLVCFAKNLTAGSIPMSAVVVNKTISDCYRQYDKPFYHSHTHSCNALAARVAGNYLDYVQNSNLLAEIQESSVKLATIFTQFKQQFAFIREVRAIGSIAAMELAPEIMHQISLHEIGINHSIYLRNIGNVVYIMPPLYNLAESLDEISGLLLGVLEDINRRCRNQ